MRVSEIMTTSVEFVDGSATVQAAAELMGELDVGALPVGSAASVEGVITDRDILFRIVARGLDPSQVLVRNAVSRPAIACRDTDTLQAVMDLMAANHIRRMPVLGDAAQVVGWITLADVSRKLLVESRTLQAALQGLTQAAAEPT